MYGQKQNLMSRFNSRANSFERSHADGPIVNAAATQLGALKGNPGFVAQFDVTILLKYFSVVDATGVYTALTAAQLLAAYAAGATQIPAFVFGNSDFASGFKKLQNLFPLNGWTYGMPVIYGRNTPRIPTSVINGGFVDATVTAQLQVGDLVIPVYSDQGATTYVALAIVRCTQVGYGTLLDALNSDRFIINMLRYVMSDTTAVGLAQYNNNVSIVKQSLFGKFDQDFVSPTSFKMPEQFQAGIIDIPIEKGVDKQVELATYLNYDAVTVQWSFFVNYLEKLAF
jgi:hypothetical protein